VRVSRSSARQLEVPAGMKTQMHQYDELNLCLQQMITGYHSLYCNSFVVLTILLVTVVKDITQGMNAIRHYIQCLCFCSCFQAALHMDIDQCF